MSGSSLPYRPQPSEGTPEAAQTSESGNSLAATCALILNRDDARAERLQGVLQSLGITAALATCPSGAAAVLREDEANGRAFDFLFVDGQFGGICGMSLCAALCMPLNKRPKVLLQAPMEKVRDSRALARSGVHAVIDPEPLREELQVLLEGYHRDVDAERWTPAGRITF